MADHSDLRNISSRDVSVSFMPDKLSALYFGKSQVVSGAFNSPFSTMEDAFRNTNDGPDLAVRNVLGEIYTSHEEMRTAVLLKVQKYLNSDYFQKKFLDNLDISQEGNALRLVPDNTIADVLKDNRPNFPDSSYQKMARNLVIAALSEVLIENNTQAVPIYEKLSPKEEDNHGILAFAGDAFVRSRPDIVLRNFPSVDVSKAEWAQISEFRKDKDSELATLRKFLALSGCSTETELTDKIEMMFEAHKYTALKFGLRVSRDVSKVILDNSVSSLIVLGSLSVLAAGGGPDELKAVIELASQDANKTLQDIVDQIGVPVTVTIAGLKTAQLSLKIGESVAARVASYKNESGAELQYLRSIEREFS